MVHEPNRHLLRSVGWGWLRLPGEKRRMDKVDREFRELADKFGKDKDGKGSQTADPVVPSDGPRVVVFGATAFDSLSRYDGSFDENLSRSASIAERDDGEPGDARVSRELIAVRAEDVSLRNGGIAANICFGMSNLGVTPVLLSAIGADGEAYLEKLRSQGVDVRFVEVVANKRTDRFDSVTDIHGKEVSFFHRGASFYDSYLNLSHVLDAVENIRFVLITSSDLPTMIRHTALARERGVNFVADPSRLLRQEATSRENVIRLIEGADYLIHNQYERYELNARAQLSDEEVSRMVRVRVTTKGPNGVDIESSHGKVTVAPASVHDRIDPTGLGDSFRAGFFGGLAKGLELEYAARLGCVLAALTLDSLGTQTYWSSSEDVLKRWRESYDDDSDVIIARTIFGISTERSRRK